MRDQIQFEGGGGSASELYGRLSVSGISQLVQRNQNIDKYKKILSQYYNTSYLSNLRRTKQITSRFSAIQSSRQSSQYRVFISREPIIFKKKLQGFKANCNLSGNYLCKLVGNKIFYKKVSDSELKNIQGKDKLKNNISTQCEFIQVPHQDSISPSIQIDSIRMHMYYYSNKTNEVVILSLKNKKQKRQICRIKAKTSQARTNPILFLIQINEKNMLLIVGGYTGNNQSVEGCKYIEILIVGDWGKYLLKSRLIKLNIGQIYPLIFFPIKIQKQQSLLFLGGNTIGKKTKSLINLDFRDPKHIPINDSSKYRSIYITTKQLMQYAQRNTALSNLPLSNHLSVRIEDQIDLYRGSVNYLRKGRFMLFLPKMTQFYTVKVDKKQVRIIKCNKTKQKMLRFPQKQGYDHLEIKYFQGSQPNKYFQITQKGIFRQKPISSINNTNFLWNIKLDYIICPCTIM